MKSTILMIPIWYPTKDNQIAGSFFKEQAEFLTQKYNFIVLTIHKRYSFFPKKTKIILESSSENLIKYDSIFYMPLFFEASNLLIGLTKIKKNQIGIGKYSTKFYRRIVEKQILKIKKKIKAHYDYVYGISSQGIAYYSYIFAKSANVPLVLGEHAPFPMPGHLVPDTLKESLENADCFFAISNDKIRQIMLQNIKLKRIQYVGNYIDETKFQYAPIKHSKKTLLIVAAYSFYKNYDMFLSTINLLHKKAKVDFNIIIAGYDANKGYSVGAKELEKKIMSLDFSSQIEMIPFVSRNEISDLYNRCDAFVLTSIQEGQPVSAIEAACCGLPIFATRCGGVEDYVNEKIGRIVDILDDIKLSDYLCDFLEERISFDKQYIRDYIISKFGSDAFLKNIQQGFEGGN